MVAPAYRTPRASAERLTLTWVGHATFLIQIGGLNVLTDPMWSERASPVRFAGPRRLVPAAVVFEKLPPIDLVLLSHNHYDHLDDWTVRQLAARHPHARWLAPLGLAPFLRDRGVANPLELDWWEDEQVGPLTLASVPARHFSSRSPRDTNRTLWCGWSIASDTRRVLFGGDSAYHPEFPAIGERCGPFHAVLLPIGAYDPRWFMGSVHMNPEEAVRAFQDLVRPQPSLSAVMVGMHWGTFKLTDEPMDEPPARARAAWQAAGLDPGLLWVLAHGETREM